MAHPSKLSIYLTAKACPLMEQLPVGELVFSLMT
jgi:hypothetical protein